VHTNSQTNKLIANKKKAAFAKIFNWLDSDQDGLISTMKIDINLIENELLEVMSPLLIELAEVQEPLNFSEFYSALNRLYETVPLPQKEILLLKT